MIHRSNLRLNLYGDSTLNYEFLFAYIGMLFSSLIFLVQSEMDSTKIQ